MGGRAYPVRHYPIAIRLRDRNSTPHQFTKLVGDPVGSRPSRCCADSSEWELFGHNTRSAFRRTPSRIMQPILQFARNFIRKSALPYCIFFPRIIMSKLLLCEEINTNRLKSIFSYKISRFTCVCAFFVVPLQLFSRTREIYTHTCTQTSN